MTIQDKWGSLDEATRRCYHQVATDPQFLREFYAFREISAYLRHVGIPLARASGPYYLTECYQLYRVEGMDPSPDMLAMVAEAYDRRIFHVRRALHLLRQKLEQRDPQAAERRGGLAPFYPGLGSGERGFTAFWAGCFKRWKKRHCRVMKIGVK